jgi:DNA polymerase
MDRGEEKIKELLYDFRRYVDQLKEDGIEWVGSAGSPARITEKSTVRSHPATGLRPEPVPKQEESSSSNRFQALVETILGCRKCGLASTRQRVVPGEGRNKRRVLLVGEGPGAEEDRLGRPFVGRSGQLLDKILTSISLTRDDIYITNIVKCRPPGNRDPRSEEVIACWPYLEEQIKILRPRIIVTLGAPAAKTLLDTDTGIGRLRGRFHDYHGIPLLPTYHPAYLLRSYTLENRKKVWEDMKLLRNFLDTGERE